MTFDVTKHHLVSPHRKISDAEKQQLLQSYNTNLRALPKIIKNDPALAKLTVKEGDVIAIERRSKTAGVSIYYRVVTSG